MPRKAAAKTEPVKVVKNLPASENGYGIHYKSSHGTEYCVSHCREKDCFTLWRIVSNGYEKMTTGSTPFELLTIADKDK